jgi:hypothetical protein
VNGVWGEGGCDHGFGPEQLVIEISSDPARVVEGLGVGAQDRSAAVVDVVFGDDAVDTAIRIVRRSN